MKRTIIIICTIWVLINCSFAQSLKKPSLMILPSDNWCTERYFVQRFDNQGTITDMVDYERAFKEDIELPTVISTIGGFLAEKGYAVKDAEQAAKNLRANIAESNAVSSKSGYGLAENTLDIIKNKVKADILIQISWTFLNSNIQYTIESFDCYSGFRIPATITGFGEKDKSSIVSVIEKDIPSRLGEFDKKLQAYFKDVNSNGHEISLDIRRWSDWDKDFDTEFEGKPLIEILEQWMGENAVNASYNLIESDENIAKYEQVHIPVYNTNGTAMDARTFASYLRKYLKSKYDIPSKIISSGLGRAVVVLGDNN